MRSYPLSFVLPGGFNWSSSQLYNQGAGAGWWFSTIYSGADGYRSSMTLTNVGSYGNRNKYIGLSLRSENSANMLIARDATKRKPAVLDVVVRWGDTRAKQEQDVTVGTREDSSRPPVAAGTLSVQLTIAPVEAAGQHKR